MRPFPLFIAALGGAIAASPAPAHERAIQFPDVPGYRTLVVDLHTHSVFSDGVVWPSVRVDESERDGLDLMAVTEHLEYQPHREDIPHPDRNRSYELAAAHAGRAASEVLLVNGAEITRDNPPGHTNAVFITDANALLQDDWRDAMAAAAEQGAFVFWNHPSWTGQTPDGVAWLSDVHRELIERDLLHGIEVANGVIYSAEALQIALDHDLAILGVSDVHGLIDWEYAIHDGDHRTTTLVFASERSAAAIREALHANRTVAWMDNNLIGRTEHVVPLIEASLEITAAWVRRDAEVVDVTLTNRSDARFQLAPRGGRRFYRQAAIIEVPPHGAVTVGVTGAPSSPFELEFEVLNAIVAPETHPRLVLPVAVE